MVLIHLAAFAVIVFAAWLLAPAQAAVAAPAIPRSDTLSSAPRTDPEHEDLARIPRILWICNASGRRPVCAAWSWVPATKHCNRDARPEKIMRAAILHEMGATPEVGEFEEPQPGEGHVVVEVAVAGVNPVDLMLASGALGPRETPLVVGSEGVGTLPDGQRVYFNSPVPPFGSWAERSLAHPDLAFPVPHGLSDDIAVAIGISGLAAWIPLEHHARVRPGETVLVLGATGVVGQIAVQVAKLLGASRVVAAGRDLSALKQVEALGADVTLALGREDDARRLRAAAGEGYDIVIDTVYGKPFLAALAASAIGARLVTVGGGAGQNAEIPFRAIQGRTHIGHGNNLTPPRVLRDAYERLAAHTRDGEIQVRVEVYALDHAADAWRAQRESPHRKLAVAP